MTLPVAIACLLAAAAVIATIRLAWQALHPGDGPRPRAWRLGLLVFAQAAGAALLWLTLFPPTIGQSTDALTVLTADAARVEAAPAASGPVVALPEAGTPGARWLGAERVPDLATALHLHPGTRRITVIGAGLTARDREALDGQALAFHPAPLRPGIVDVQPPVRVAVGRGFIVQGRANGAAGLSVELIDPAGGRGARVPLQADGRFLLHGTARSAGPATFHLRLRDARGQQVEEAPLPLDVAPARALRVLVLAGAPNAELKYLRRWALDTGLTMDTRIDLGAGLQITSRALPLDAATLDRQDLVVLDERSLRTLGSGSRAALEAAVSRGLGLLIRQTSPPDADDRERLRQLGFDLRPDAAKDVRLGAGFARPGDAADALPTLTTGMRLSSADGIPLVTDAAARPLAAWRARGRGRIGVTAFDGSFRLVLAGRRDAHGELWSRVFTPLARMPDGVTPPVITPAPAGERTRICGLGDTARVVDPAGTQSRLRIDPRSGPERCAGYWARTDGGHTLIDGPQRTPFHIGSTAAMQAWQLRTQTQARVRNEAASASAASLPVPGPRWPWFAAWLLLSTLVWWLERSRIGLILASVRK